jgi:exodeoxyribonuclease-3
MKVFSWNVNGIRAVVKKGYFKTFIEAHHPDILCLQETKAEEGQAEIDLPEYEEYWSSAHKKGYSGTAIFTKESPIEAIYGIPAEIGRKFDLGDGYGDTQNEGRVTTLEFEHFFVTSVYTPNAKDDLSRIPVRKEWDAAFLAYMKHLEKEKPMVFCGDLNVAHTEIDLARPKENAGKKGFTDEERGGFDALLGAGFVDTFRLFEKDGGHYSWWSPWGGARDRNVGWRIDYVMVSPSLVPLIKSARIHSDVFGSDHCPVSIDIAL